MALLDRWNLAADFPVTRRYLVGVSGGHDSVVLLHSLVTRGYKRLIVCHLNHRLRGRAATADAKFVQRLARRLQLECEVASADVRKLARERKQSIEAAGRDARYAFFAAVARRRRCRTIFLGHHADDLVETFLINLFRGAGTSGLASIRDTSTRRIDGVELTIARPLLHVWRSEIDAHIAADRLEFREDASNRDLSPLRNRIRHRIIPYLEKACARDLRQNIWRAAMIAADEENFLDSLLTPPAVAERDAILTGLTGHVPININLLRGLDVALQRRSVRRWLLEANVRDVGFDLIERVREIADPASRTAKTNLPRNRHARRRAGKLFIE